MIWLAIFLTCLCAGCLQSVTGFGAAIIMMQVFPYFLGMITSPALVGATCLALSGTLTWRFRRQINWQAAILPTAIYICFNLITINLVRSVDLTLLTAAFGFFMILLSGYFLLFSGKVSFKANWKTAALCATFSGCTAGFFGIGGPLMALYFISSCKSKENYIASLQFMFFASDVVSLCMRAAKGIYIVDLIPLTLLGFVGVTIGKKWGLKLLDKLNIERMKKIVYIFVGISGLVTVLRQLL